MLFMRKRGTQVRYKKLRLFLDDCLSFLKGWYFRFAKKQTTSSIYDESWVSVAEFSTAIRWRPELKEINQNRIDNMKLSCQKINGVLLRPGEVFSMRRLIGEPNLQNGFKDGPVLINGKLTYSSGGGLCQVSTMLFNTALLAGLKILQKYNHSWDIWGNNRFIDLGRDAVYAYARRDLKFKNNLSQDIVIVISVDEAQLLMNCRMLSPQKKDAEITLSTRMVRELKHPDLQTNKPLNTTVYQSGWIVETQRYTSNAKLRKRRTYKKTEIYRPVKRKEPINEN